VIQNCPRFTTRFMFWFATLIVAVLLPPTAAHAKTLASKALADAIENGTLDQVKQELFMDVHQKQKFEFDEAGMEELGRKQLDQGKERLGVEILQINQVIHNTSPRAANALGDGYRASGDDISARVYYDMALRMDPGNEHAKQAIEESGESAEELAMGGMEFDPEAMQAAMAQMGMEMTPEQQQMMQEGMAQLQQLQETGEMPQASSQPKQQASRQTSPSDSQPTHESEFCEVLHRFNAEKKITDPQVRARVEGEYGEPGDTLRTWNVESTCGEFLIAVPLWADVSPPVLDLKGGSTFEDANGWIWKFEMGGDGKAKSVVQTSSDGETTEMKRLGDPRSYD